MERIRTVKTTTSHTQAPYMSSECKGSEWKLHVCVCKVASIMSRLTLCDPVGCSSPVSSVPWDSPGKNIGVGHHILFQGIFPTQGSNLHCSQIFYHWVTREALGSISCIVISSIGNRWLTGQSAASLVETVWSHVYGTEYLYTTHIT